MTHVARKRARRRGAGRSGEVAAQWADLVAALARGEAGPGVQAYQRHALAGVLRGLHALRQDPPPQVVVVINEVDVLAQQACGPLGAELARRLEKGRSAGVALALVESRPTATWIT
jgi:DNA segregation ATPase FtsK/SpoIIIE-like protein